MYIHFINGVFLSFQACIVSLQNQQSAVRTAARLQNWSYAAVMWCAVLCSAEDLQQAILKAAPMLEEANAAVVATGHQAAADDARVRPALGRTHLHMLMHSHAQTYMYAIVHMRAIRLPQPFKAVTRESSAKYSEVLCRYVHDVPSANRTTSSVLPLDTHCHTCCDLQAAARSAPQLTRDQIRQMRRAHDPNFKERTSGCC